MKPGFNLFGLFVRGKGGNHRIADATINLGCTKGRGSSTRMFNYCNQRSANPSQCINQFINVAPPQPPPTISVSYTGASIFYSNPYTGTSNGYTYLKFTNSGTINIISDSVTIYYVIVGGGGNGNTRSNGSSGGGGGGGGGQVLSGSLNLTSGTYNIVVGSSGQTSSFYTLTAANGESATNTGNGGNSGSGGLGGVAVLGNNQEVPGNPGVNGGGGGGGYNVDPPGNGGDGPIINFADGSSGIYFGGGGGGGYSGGGGTPNTSSGGAGGGGRGSGALTPESGLSNTGGGGGGGAWNGASTVGGAGASGVVLIYYI